jgi:hypothetical protein
MNSFFEHTGLSASDTTLRVLGNLAPRVVDAMYPLEQLTRFHNLNHITGLTGTWMDKGGTALGGIFKGNYHRLSFGHHLFDDGFKVLVNPELKFGEFLHHLGMDSLTSRGIPNPFIPKGVGEALLKLGFKKAFVHEFLTLNVPKILGGSLSLVCAGSDVFMAFSDAIPHTFGASGMHFLFGAMNIGFGMFPPNPLLLLSGGVELGVSAMTAYKAAVDPLIPTLGVPMSVYLPALGHAVALAAIISSCVGIFSGTEWKKLPELLSSTSAAAAVGTTVAFTAKAAGYVSPFCGPLAGIATYIIMRNIWRSMEIESDAISYEPAGTDPSLNVFRHGATIPLFQVPTNPIGTLRCNRLLISEQGVRDMFYSLAAA